MNHLSPTLYCLGIWFLGGTHADWISVVTRDGSGPLTLRYRFRSRPAPSGAAPEADPTYIEALPDKTDREVISIVDHMMEDMMRDGIRLSWRKIVNGGRDEVARLIQAEARSFLSIEEIAALARRPAPSPRSELDDRLSRLERRVALLELDLLRRTVLESADRRRVLKLLEKFSGGPPGNGADADTNAWSTGWIRTATELDDRDLALSLQALRSASFVELVRVGGVEHWRITDDGRRALVTSTPPRCED